jgi:hypothetical protein
MPSHELANAPKRGRPPARAAEIARLEKTLEPAGEEIIANRLGPLIAAFPARDGGGAIDLRMQCYVMALAPYSVETLSQATMLVIEGLAADVDPTWMPSPAELARLCRTIDRPRREQLVRLQREIEQIAKREEGPTRTPSPTRVAGPPSGVGLPDDGNSGREVRTVLDRETGAPMRVDGETGEILDG